MTKYVADNETLTDALRTISPTFRAHAEEAEAAVETAAEAHAVEQAAVLIAADVTAEAVQA